MTINNRDDVRIHPAAEMYAREHIDGQMSRREFLARATALGLTATAAYGLIGLKPAQAEGHLNTPSMGGTLRIEMNVLAQNDPRTYDFTQRHSGVSGVYETLVEVARDGTFHGVLLESWDINNEATEYTLNIRPGVKWNNGEALTADHVAANIVAWCDKTLEGNSMASRFAVLVDENTNQAIEGTIQVVDDTTVKLVLPSGDITLIPAIADYPALVIYPDNIGADPLENPIGTGAYKIESYDVGVGAALVRNEEHEYWGNAYLDRVEFIDLGTDPAASFSAAESDEFDMNYDSVGEFVEIFDAIGWVKSEIATASTIVIRPNQEAEIDGMKPYADVRVRRALALAVDNAVLLELGYSNLGTTADNHHVSPIHPEFAEVPWNGPDVDEARRLMEEAGMMDFEHELISLDDDWRRNTTDACAAQLRDAGFKVKRTIIPGTSFWNDWTKYPFSSTNWNGRELGVMVLALAYRSGEAWNESGFANAEFDALLNEAMTIADADTRRETMAKIQKIMQDEGVVIQPYWRSLYRHTKEGVVNGERHQKDIINIHHLGWA